MILASSTLFHSIPTLGVLHWWKHVWKCPPPFMWSICKSVPIFFKSASSILGSRDGFKDSFINKTWIFFITFAYGFQTRQTMMCWKPLSIVFKKWLHQLYWKSTDSSYTQRSIAYLHLLVWNSWSINALLKSFLSNHRLLISSSMSTKMLLQRNL